LPRQATDSAIRNRVREYLDFVSFSADAKARLTASLAELALDGLGSAELVERAEAFLLAARVVLPARATLERLVASLNRQALEALFTCIAGRFSASTRATCSMSAVEIERRLFDAARQIGCRGAGVDSGGVEAFMAQ
jgi:hypothetical protein